MLGLHSPKATVAPELARYTATAPHFDLREYFNGPIQAWGLVQDWRGRVVTRFDLLLHGQWHGDQGTLTEEFAYYDGSRQSRVWQLQRQAPNQYLGHAGDLIGAAHGRSSGCAVRWRYTMDLDIRGRHYHLNFDDWMWLMNDGVLINRSAMRKFGIKVAELTVFMRKVTS